MIFTILGALIGFLISCMIRGFFELIMNNKRSCDTTPAILVTLGSIILGLSLGVGCDTILLFFEKYSI